MKNIILGILVCISAVFTVYYLYDLNQTYIRAQTRWNDVAQRTFREAVDIEVNQINDTPIQFTPVHFPENSTLKDPYPEYVRWESQYGEREYFIPLHKFQNSYVTNWEKRIILSLLLEEHPIPADALNRCWDSLLLHQAIKVQTNVRCAVTDLAEHTDTVYSKGKVVADSLISIYLGHRCETELTAYIAYPQWWTALGVKESFILLLPWALCVLLAVFYGDIKKVVHLQPVMAGEGIKERIPVENSIQEINNPKDKITEYKFRDGTYFDATKGELHGANQCTVLLSPQERLLLTAFLKSESHQVSMNKVIDSIWGVAGNSAKFHRLLQRLRNSLKKVTSATIKNIGKGIYQLSQSEDTEDMRVPNSKL